MFRPPYPSRASTPVVVIALLTLLTLLPMPAALADEEGPAEVINEYVVYSPHVVEGQSEVEISAAEFRDSSLVLNDTRGYVFSLAHSFTGWWKPELYLGMYQTLPRNPNRLMAHELENTFQFTEPGEYWADLGFLLSYKFNTHLGEPNAWEFGPLFEKQSGQYRQRLNLLWEKQVGTGAKSHYEFRTNYSLNYAWRRAFAPGINLFLRPGQNVYQAGPAVSGEWYVGNSELEYNVALVVGVNRNAPDKTLLLNLEYEFF